MMPQPMANSNNESTPAMTVRGEDNSAMVSPVQWAAEHANTADAEVRSATDAQQEAPFGAEGHLGTDVISSADALPDEAKEQHNPPPARSMSHVDAAIAALRQSFDLSGSGSAAGQALLSARETAAGPEADVAEIRLSPTHILQPIDTTAPRSPGIQLRPDTPATSPVPDTDPDLMRLLPDAAEAGPDPGIAVQRADALAPMQEPRLGSNSEPHLPADGSSPEADSTSDRGAGPEPNPDAGPDPDQHPGSDPDPEPNRDHAEDREGAGVLPSSVAGLPPDHPLLARAQAALRAQLQATRMRLEQELPEKRKALKARSRSLRRWWIWSDSV